MAEPFDSQVQTAEEPGSIRVIARAATSIAAFIGRTLKEIASSLGEMRGVFLRSILRGGVSIPVAPGTIIERGDVLSVTLGRFAWPLVGRPSRHQQPPAA